MPSELLIAAVSFLNTVPLLEGLEDRQDVRLTLDLPSRLADRLREGEADAALVPVAEILRGATGGILSPSGIACDGAVDSVMLFTAADPGELECVFVDRGSRSSVALLRILLTELHGVRPEFVEIEPRPGGSLGVREGVLIIGDRCFAQQAALARGECAGQRGYDLGAMWKELTGLPFVFAAWAGAPDLVDRRGREAACALGDLLTAARDRGLARLDEIAAEQAAAGRLGRGGEATADAIAYYYRHSLRFVLDDAARRGMERFQELAQAHDVVPAGPPPVWLCRGAENAD